jgi:hypothetical protein
MKSLSIAFFLSVLIFTSCKEDSEMLTKSASLNGIFDSMHFVRQGGGQIDFNLYATSSADTLKAVVSQYNFRDTTIQLTVCNNSKNASAFSSFQKVMNDQVQLNGDFQQPTSLTGTWSYLYFVNDNKKTEVTNTELRNSLLQFEQSVRDKIQ